MGLGGRTLFRTFEVAGVSSFFCFFVFFLSFFVCFFVFFWFCFCFSCSYLSNYDYHLKATFPFKYDIWFHFVNLLCLLSKDTMIHQTAHCQLKRREGSAQFYTTFIFQRRNGENCAGGNYLQNTCINQSKQMIRLLITGEKSK